MQNDYAIVRAQMWTPDLNKLLRKWKIVIGKAARAHAENDKKFDKRHYALGLPTVLIGAAVSVGIFATFRNCDVCDDQSLTRCDADQWIRLAAGILGLISACLSAMMTFLNYAEASQSHKNAASDFGSLYLRIDALLTMPPENRGKPLQELNNIRSVYEDLVRRSPGVDETFDYTLSYEVGGRGVPIDPNKVKGFSFRERRRRRKKLQELVQEDNEILQEENKDVEENDNKKVTIGIDLDATPTVADSSPIPFITRDIQTDSRRRALEFELERLNNNIYFDDYTGNILPSPSRTGRRHSLHSGRRSSLMHGRVMSSSDSPGRREMRHRQAELVGVEPEDYITESITDDDGIEEVRVDVRDGLDEYDDQHFRVDLHTGRDGHKVGIIEQVHHDSDKGKSEEG